MKHLVIIGARGYGRIVYNIAIDCILNGADFDIKGFLDDKSDALEGMKGYPPILGPVEEYNIQEDDIFICALGEVKYKKKYAEIILNKGGEFVSLVSPKATIMTNVHIGSGCIIGGQSTVGCDTILGQFVTILGYACIGHDVVVEDWSHIGAYCFMGGFSKLEEGATMQTGAKLIPHKKVGRFALVGAGSLCIRNVKPGITVFGNPAKEISE